MADEPTTDAGILLVCGEPSGDLHASELVAELRRLMPVRVVAAGGSRLAAAGAEVRWDSTNWGAIGLPEALRKLPLYWSKMAELVRAAEELRPALLLLVDFGAFNLRLAARVRRRHPALPVFYYFPPSSWDRQRRYYGKMLQFTDYVATPFPWNAAQLAAQGATARWIGHPAVDRVRPAEDKAAAKAEVGADPDTVVLALLPGSRKLERNLLGETFLRAAEELRRRLGRVEVLWSSLQGFEKTDWGLGVGARRIWARPVQDTAALLRAADLGFCSFGTVTLEAALAGVPVVTAYRGTLAMKLVYRFMDIPTRHYSMPNIIVGEAILPEVLGDEATPERLVEEGLALLKDEERRERVAQAYAKVREKLGPPGAARRAAEMVVKALEGRLRPHRRPLG